MKRFWLFACLSLPFVLFSSESDCDWTQKEYQPWFTGAILAPSPTTRSPRLPAFEAAIVGADRYGRYDGHWHRVERPTIWSVGPYLGLQLGFTKIFGVDFIGAMTSNFCHGASYTHPLDTILRLGFQVSRDQKDSWIPDFRILLQETFPSGRYEHFSLNKMGTDLSGSGSYQTGIHLAFQKLFRRSCHPFRIRGSLGFFLPASVHVAGLNAYGGNNTTLAKVRPGSYATAYLLFEYRLCYSWALGLESNYRQGMKGRTRTKQGGKVFAPPFSELSFAPQLEHTYSEHLASRLGGWVSLVGKNTTAFATLFTSVLYKF